MIRSRTLLITSFSAVIAAMVGLSPAIGDDVATPSPSPPATAYIGPAAPSFELLTPSLDASSEASPTASSNEAVPPLTEGSADYPSRRELNLPSGEMSDELMAAYYTLQTELFIDHPDEWGDAYMDGDVLFVNTVTRSVDEAAEVLKELGVSGSIKIQQVETSIADFEAMERAMAASRLRKDLAIVGPDYSQGRLLVGIRSKAPTSIDTSDVVAVLEQGAARYDYAPVPVVLYAGGDPQAAARWYDVSPFYAGAYIAMYDADGVRGLCSDAFTWHKAPYTYMLTAGHCARFRNGDNANIVKRKDTTAAGYEMGTVPWASINYLGTISGRHGDFAMIRLNSGLDGDPRVYSGPGNATTWRPIMNTSAVAQGTMTSLRTSAASCKFNASTDCEINPTVIYAVNQLVLMNDGYDIYNLSLAEDVDECIGLGDSGGAIYTVRPDSGANALGVLSSFGTNGAEGCLISFTPITYVYDDFGGALVVD